MQLEIKEAVSLVALYPWWSIRDPNGLPLVSSDQEKEKPSFEQSIMNLKGSGVYPAVQLWYGTSPKNKTQAVVILDAERMASSQNFGMPFMGTMYGQANANTQANPFNAYYNMGVGGFAPFGNWNGQAANAKDQAQAQNGIPVNPYEAMMAGMDARMKEQQAQFYQQIAMLQVQNQANLENQKVELSYLLLEKDKEALEKEKERMEEERDKIAKNPLSVAGASLMHGAVRYADKYFLGGLFTSPLPNSEENISYSEEEEAEEISPRRSSRPRVTLKGQAQASKEDLDSNPNSQDDEYDEHDEQTGE